MCIGTAYCFYCLALCSTPLLCSQYSTAQGTVNVVPSVMMWVTLHLTGPVSRRKSFQTGHGRIAFYEHGGKTGRATVKYPGY